MRKYFIIFIVALLVLRFGCSDNKQYINIYSDPAKVIAAFFEACATMDSCMINELSSVEEYPLITEWNIRRISETYEIYSIKIVEDTLHSLLDTINVLSVYKTSYEDSLKYLELKLNRIMSTIEASNKAEIEWEEAELAHIYKRSPESLTKAKELKKKKDRLQRETKEALKAYDENDIKKLQELRQEIKKVDNDLVEIRKIASTFLKLSLAITKSLNTNSTSNNSSVCMKYSIVDLKIPCKAGIMLNKKVKVTLISVDCSNRMNKWIIYGIDYIGE